MSKRAGAFNAVHPAKPAKTCAVCREPIAWRRWLARNWEKLSYCSAACRRAAYDRARRKADARNVAGPLNAETSASAA